MSEEKVYPFNEAFELAVVRQVLADPALLARVSPYVTPSKFTLEPVRLLVESAVRIHRDHGVAPTPAMALQEVRAQVEAGKVQMSVLEDCEDAIARSNEQPPPASSYVQEQIAHAERRAAVWRALDRGYSLYKEDRLPELAEAFDRAIQIGATDGDPGVDQESDLQRRTESRIRGDRPPRWGTGITDLDDVLGGGLGEGELGVIMGGPKFGKTQALGWISMFVASQGGTVVYVTLEMDEREMLERLDGAIARVPVLEVPKRAQYVAGKVQDFYDRTGGSIIIKYLPQMRTTAADVRTYLQNLRAERSVAPTVLVIDSGDHMKSVMRVEKRYDELGQVYTEIRNLGKELRVPTWTSTWATRASLEKQVVTIADMGDSYKKVAVADVIVAMCRTEDERRDRTMRMSVAACRYSTDGVVVGPFPTAMHIGRLLADKERGD